MLAGFLTAVLQNQARKDGISVDSLSFNFHIMKPRGEIFKTERQSFHLVIHDTAFGVSVLAFA